MHTEGVDPRDVEWEQERPIYRVYFWGKGEAPAHIPESQVGYYSDEHRVLGAIDVHEVLAWAGRTAKPNETFTLYVELQGDSGTGLIRLAGVDPTAP